MPLTDEQMDESTPLFVEQLQTKFTNTDTGYIVDNVTRNPVWCLSVSAFESWFSELESALNQTLGRRLAHAAAESEEWYWGMAPAFPKSWFSQQKKRISLVNADWNLRGMGQIDLLESADGRSTIIIANRANSAVAAGMGNAAWECIEEQRFRFQWSDRGVGETVVELTPDKRPIPSPKNSAVPWPNNAGIACSDERNYHRARHEMDGMWTVEGNRVMMLFQDAIIRFEQLTLPYLAKTERSSDSRTEWVNIDSHDQVVLWDSMAEAARKQFLASGALVLITTKEHWMDVASRHLSMEGLGCVEHASSIDDNGGVELTLPAAIHPAIVVGRLLGCWERAEGRAAKATWESTSKSHRIVLQSRREIA